MENLNQKTVVELATMLKVEPSKLREQLLTSEADEAKMETKIGEVLPKLTIMPTMDFESLVKNTGNQKYKEGKAAGEEMPLKVQAKKYNLPDSVTTWDALIPAVIEAEIKKSGTPTDERVKEFEKEKTTLQALVQQKEAELTKVRGEIEEVKTGFTINGVIEKAIMEIPIDADATKLNGQREILATLFKQKHTVKMEDGKQVVYRDGQKLVDGVLNPISVQDALKDFAPAYVNVKTDIKGRGDEPGNLQLSADISGIKDKASFQAYMEKKGIKNYSSPEAIAIYREVKSKNPALQF